MVVTRKLRQAEQAIRRGKVLILCHTEQLFESLYMVLNQQYWAQDEVMMIQIALGPSSRAIVLPDGPLRIIALHVPYTIYFSYHWLLSISLITFAFIFAVFLVIKQLKPGKLINRYNLSVFTGDSRVRSTKQNWWPFSIWIQHRITSRHTRLKL